MWVSTSSLFPDIPIGYFIPPWLSTTNSLGIMCIGFKLSGNERVLAFSIALYVSSIVISALATATTPLLFKLVTNSPLIDTYTSETVTPAILSAAITLSDIAFVASSILTTTPFFIPLLGYEHTPITEGV